MSGRNECRIYVGNLPPNIGTKAVQGLFYNHGMATIVALKNLGDQSFAFVEFEDPRDAEDAVHARDGYDYNGFKLRVYFPRRGGPSYYTSYDRGRGLPTRSSKYRVLVSGLPPSGTWQDLKDHMRVAGGVVFANVFNDGTGFVEFTHYEDMQYAYKKLNDSRFRSRMGETSHIRVTKDYYRGRDSYDRSIGERSGRSRSRRASQRRRGSPTYSPVQRNSFSQNSRSRSHSWY